MQAFHEPRIFLIDFNFNFHLQYHANAEEILNKIQGIIKYAQFSCIFCSIFLYYFSLEVAHQVSNDGLMSFMGISPFLSLIYHIEFSLLTDFFPL